jgi:hypothetical protein
VQITAYTWHPSQSAHPGNVIFTGTWRCSDAAPLSFCSCNKVKGRREDWFVPYCERRSHSLVKDQLPSAPVAAVGMQYCSWSDVSLSQDKKLAQKSLKRRSASGTRERVWKRRGWNKKGRPLISFRRERKTKNSSSIHLIGSEGKSN